MTQKTIYYNIYNDMPVWELFARVLWGEAEAQGIQGQMEVASVIMNRLRKPKRFGDNIRDILLKPYQFECLWHTERAPRLIGVGMANPIMIQCVGIAWLYMQHQLPDVTGGADHYYSRSIPAPYWAKDDRYQLTAESASGHNFYRETLA